MLRPKCRAMSFVRPPRAAISLICKMTPGGTVGGMVRLRRKREFATRKAAVGEPERAGLADSEFPRSEFRIVPLPIVEIVVAVERIGRPSPESLLLIIEDRQVLLAAQLAALRLDLGARRPL